MVRKFIAAFAFALVGLFASITPAHAIDVNTADETQLQTIKGIGPAISARIVAERRKGNFKDWADFQSRVNGVGDKTSASMSQNGLTVAGASRAAAPAATKPTAPSTPSAMNAPMKTTPPAPTAAPAPAAMAGAGPAMAPAAATAKAPMAKSSAAATPTAARTPTPAAKADAGPDTKPNATAGRMDAKAATTIDTRVDAKAEAKSMTRVDAKTAKSDARVKAATTTEATADERKAAKKARKGDATTNAPATK